MKTPAGLRAVLGKSLLLAGVAGGLFWFRDRLPPRAFSADAGLMRSGGMSGGNAAFRNNVGLPGNVRLSGNVGIPMAPRPGFPAQPSRSVAGPGQVVVRQPWRTEGASGWAEFAVDASYQPTARALLGKATYAQQKLEKRLCALEADETVDQTSVEFLAEALAKLRQALSATQATWPTQLTGPADQGWYYSRVRVQENLEQRVAALKARADGASAPAAVEDGQAPAIAEGAVPEDTDAPSSESAAE